MVRPGGFGLFEGLNGPGQVFNIPVNFPVGRMGIKENRFFPGQVEEPSVIAIAGMGD